MQTNIDNERKRGRITRERTEENMIRTMQLKKRYILSSYETYSLLVSSIYFSTMTL